MSNTYDESIRIETITIIGRHPACGKRVTIHGDAWDDVHGVCPHCDEEIDMLFEVVEDLETRREAYARIADTVAGMPDGGTGWADAARLIARHIRETQL